MLVEVIAFFQCARDARDAVETLETGGVSADVVHVIERGGPVDARNLPCVPAEGHCLEEAQYAAHGEHLGSHFAAASSAIQEMPSPRKVDRTVVSIRDNRCSIDASQIVETLYAHGALATRANNGPWRRSPYRASTQA